MTSGSEKNYIACQASYPHSVFGRHLYDFFIVGAVSITFLCIFARGRRGVRPSATTLTLAEPLTTLVRSAHSRVSLVARLNVACGRTPRLPAQDFRKRVLIPDVQKISRSRTRECV